MSHSDHGDPFLDQTIEQASPHDHLCLIYETVQEQLAAAVSFIRIGLERGEKCIYIVDENAASTVIDAMKREGIDAEESIRSGALSIVDKRAYLAKGYFDPEMISFLKGEVEAAEKAGYPALRVTGEMTWAPVDNRGVEQFIEYEAKLNHFFPANKVIGICQYNRQRFQPEVLLDVIRTHPKVISGGLICRNPYYMPQEEFLSGNGVSQEVERLLRDIVDRKKNEIALRESYAALRRSEEELADFFENAAMALHWVGPDGIILRANRAELDLLGYTREEYVGRHIAEFHADSDAIEDILSRLRRGETLQNYEARLRCKDGSIKQVLIDSNVRWEEGKFVHTRCFTRDVTEQKRFEAALDRSRRQYEQMVNSLDGIVWEADAETFQFSFVSKQAERILGYPAERWLKEPGFWRDHIHPEDRDWALAFCMKATREMQDHRFEYRMIAADGRFVWLQDLVTVIVEQGRPMVLRGVMVDVTRRKEAEEALRLSEERYERAAASGRVGVWELDIATNALYLSPNLKSLLGYADHELPNHLDAWCQLVHPDDKDRVIAATEAHLQNKTPLYEVEVRRRHKDGSYRWFLARGTALRHRDGTPYRLTGSDADITERKQVEEALRQKTVEAEQANRLKSQFLSNVSHELRTPLNAIFGYSHLLLNEAYGALGEEQRPVLDGIQRNAKELAQLINDVLDLAKIEAGKMSLHLSEVSLGALIEEALLGIRPLSEKKALPIRCVIDPELPSIESDAGKIKQILVNLLSNAVKFTCEGEITVCARKRPDQAGVVLAVKDTGIGIRSEDLPRIFDPFHQIDGADTREFGGVGLGLAIVRELLLFLGGEIFVESEYGKGSTFTVLLPIRNPIKNARTEKGGAIGHLLK